MENRGDPPRQASLMARDFSWRPRHRAPQEDLWEGAQCDRKLGLAAARQRGLPGKFGIHGPSGFAVARSLGTGQLGGPQRLSCPEPVFPVKWGPVGGGSLGGCGSDLSAQTRYSQTSAVQEAGRCPCGLAGQGSGAWTSVPQIRVHPEPGNETVFGNRVFVGVISLKMEMR